MLKCTFRLGMGVSFAASIDERHRQELLFCTVKFGDMPARHTGHVRWQLEFSDALEFLERVDSTPSLRTAIVNGIQYVGTLFESKAPLTFDWLRCNVSSCDVDIVTPGESGFTSATKTCCSRTRRVHFYRS